MHVKFFIAAVICVSLTGCGGSSSDDYSQSSVASAPVSHWYAGGTLQKATLGQWRAGSYQNRLASSADFAAYVVNKTGKTLGSMDELRPMATQIERCITESAGNGGKSDAMKVSDVAATCVVLMGLV